MFTQKQIAFIFLSYQTLNHSAAPQKVNFSFAYMEDADFYSLLSCKMLSSIAVLDCCGINLAITRVPVTYVIYCAVSFGASPNWLLKAAGNETENCDVMLDCSKYLS